MCLPGVIITLMSVSRICSRIITPVTHLFIRPFIGVKFHPIPGDVKLIPGASRAAFGFVRSQSSKDVAHGVPGRHRKVWHTGRRAANRGWLLKPGQTWNNWVIICYLPPIKGTRKLHWWKVRESINGTSLGHRYIYLQYMNSWNVGNPTNICSNKK